MINPDIAYLLGMIAAKGVIRRGNKETEIMIQIPHKNLEIEDENTQQSVKASLLDIINRLKPLIGTDIAVDVSSSTIAYIKFTKDNGDYLIRTIRTYFARKTSWSNFRIPKEIIISSKDIKKEFLRGFADVTAHIRKSNVAWNNYEHRVYIEIMSNWDMVIDIANLLKDLDIPIQTIRWAHPNFVDTNQKYYKKGITNYKEHQVKIWAEEFNQVGFNIGHKNRLLKKYSRLNNENWDNYCKENAQKASSEKSKSGYLSKIGNLDIKHHKFYWESKRKYIKQKPQHPDEDNSRIHSKIRGKHFDSWKEVAKELGYNE